MRLFKNLFQKQSVDQKELVNTPDSALFVEHEPPEQKNRSEAPNEVAAFLNENHLSAGLSAGYHMHCHDGLSFHLSQLKTRFRQCADYLIVDLQNQLSEKELIRIQLGDMLPSQRQCLELSLECSRRQIEEARQQKVLSVDDEGWVSDAVSSFRLGFQKGMLDYFNEKDFFKNL